MSALQKIANEKNIFLVEDAAQAHLAEYKGNKVGGLSEVASFSFYPGKNLGAYGEAGAVVTNNDELAKKIIKLREHGQSEKYHHDSFGHNYRMEGIQGAVLGVKLKHLAGWTDKRRSVAGKYKELLGNIEQVSIPEELPGLKHVYHLYVVRVNGKSLEEREEKRNKLQSFLSDNGIASGLHYPVPLHLQKCFSYLGYNKGDFPVTEDLAQTGISLPMFPELKDEQIEYVALKIKEFFKK